MARIETRIDDETKEKAIAKLQKSQITLSEFVRAQVAMVVSDRLPPFYPMPNVNQERAIPETADDLTGKKNPPDYFK